MYTPIYYVKIVCTVKHVPDVLYNIVYTKLSYSLLSKCGINWIIIPILGV